MGTSAAPVPATALWGASRWQPLNPKTPAPKTPTPKTLKPRTLKTDTPGEKTPALSLEVPRTRVMEEFIA
jgi:hypothetical protein